MAAKYQGGPTKSLGQSVRSGEPNKILELRRQTVYPKGKGQLTPREVDILYFRGFCTIDRERNRV